MTRRSFSTAVAIALLAAIYVPAVARAQDVVFGEPSAEAVIGEPLTLTTTITGSGIAAVDVVLRLDGHETSVIVDAAAVEPAGTWQMQQEIDVAVSSSCACNFESPGTPNTRFEYQFRVHHSDGSVTLGPVASALVEDERFEWRTLEQGVVNVHWYAGTDAFAAEVAQIANEAVDQASELFGVTRAEPFDFFVYDTQHALVDAVSPNRENIAGQFNSLTDTMVGHVDESIDEQERETIRHEVTHGVFHDAVDNPYHSPPTWLDEGVAVYLSVGYASYWQAPVDDAVANGTLIPLQGLRGFFPSTQDGFYLGYGEAVAAVDFFVRTHGEEQLWELVRSYAEGLSDDEAFIRATGADVAEFNRAWFESLGLVPPGPAGPQPGQPGREPAEWESNAPSSPSPSAGPGSSAAATPRPGATPTPIPANPARSDLTGPLLVGALLVLVIVGGAIALIVARQYNRSQRPPGTPPYGPPPGPPPF